MKILGLVASARKLGNTEILVKEAVDAAKEKSGLIRLTDLDIKPCNGCLMCVFNNAQCTINDDMNFLLGEFDKADATIIGSPTYVLGPPGVIKMIIDRFYMTPVNKRTELKRIKAGTIAVAGITGWDPYSLAFLNILPLAMGFNLIESILVHSPGPGEILLNDDSMRKAHELGMKISGKASSKPLESNMEPSCPLCKGIAFKFIEKNIFECPNCSIRGSFTEDKQGFFTFKTTNFKDNRWSDNAIKEHTKNWVKMTEGRFKERLKQIITLRKKYKNMEIPWLKPERS